ncbi:MAG: AmmeMemoRadiSam system protein B [Calditrichaceae bacterium]
MRFKKSAANFITLILILALTNLVFSQETRPIRDEIGFCWNGDEMNAFMEFLGQNNINADSITNQNLIAAVSPHDDYLYAGNVYFPLFSHVRAKEAIVFGVTHGTVRREIADPKNILILDDYKYWQGPYGKVAVSSLRERIKNGMNPKDYLVSNKAHSLEHSIEALIPFLQYFNREIKITPVMVTAMSYEEMDKISDQISQIITEYIKENQLTPGKDIIFLVSSDANHYGADFNNTPYGEDAAAHNKATMIDRQIARDIFDGIITKERVNQIPGKLWDNPEKQRIVPLWCGRYPIPFGLLTVIKIMDKEDDKVLTGRVIRYSDTWSEKVLPFKEAQMGITAPFSVNHWVGFLSAGFYLQEKNKIR